MYPVKPENAMTEDELGKGVVISVVVRVPRENKACSGPGYAKQTVFAFVKAIVRGEWGKGTSWKSRCRRNQGYNWNSRYLHFLRFAILPCIDHDLPSTPDDEMSDKSWKGLRVASELRVRACLRLAVRE